MTDTATFTVIGTTYDELDDAALAYCIRLFGTRPYRYELDIEPTAHAGVPPTGVWWATVSVALLDDRPTSDGQVELREPRT